MAPDSSISFRWLLTSSTIGGGICLKHSLNGVSSVTLMVCSVKWVHPSSAGSNENTLVYSARSWWAFSANLGALASKPPKSNSLNSLPHLCIIINFGVGRSAHASSGTGRLPGLGVLVSNCTGTTLATGIFSKGFGDRHCGSALPPLPSYCPSSVQYTCSAWLGQVARCHPGHTEPVPSC